MNASNPFNAVEFAPRELYRWQEPMGRTVIADAWGIALDGRRVNMMAQRCEPLAPPVNRTSSARTFSGSAI